MGRTNVVVDDELVARVMKLYGLRTKREAIDFALRKLAGRGGSVEGLLALQGSGWEGDLEQMRRSRFPEGFEVKKLPPRQKKKKKKSS